MFLVTLLSVCLNAPCAKTQYILRSAIQSVVGGASRPSAPTADADTGAGLRGSNDVGERSASGGVISAPSKDDHPPWPCLEDSDGWRHDGVVREAKTKLKPQGVNREVVFAWCEQFWVLGTNWGTNSIRRPPSDYPTGGAAAARA